MKKRIAGLGLIALIAIVALAGCQGLPLAGGVAQADVAPTATVQVVASARSEYIVAEAKVEAAEWRPLSLEIGGVVQEIMIEEGDAVEAGDPLVRLDSADLARAVSTAEQNLVIQQANLDTLLKGATDADIAAAQAALDSARETLQRVKDGPDEEDIAAAEASLEAAKETLLRVQDGPEEEDIAAAQASLDAAKETYQKVLDGPDELDLAQLKARVSTAEARLSEAQAFYDEVSWRNDLGALPQSTALMYATIEYEAARAAYDNAAAGAGSDQLASARASIAGAEATLQQLLDSPTAADLANARAAVAQAQSQITTLLDSPNAADVASAEAAVVQAQSRLTTLLDGATDEDIAVARAVVAQAKITLEAAGDNLRKAILRAPFAGAITLVQVEVGDLVGAGRIVLTLATTQQLQVRTTDLVETDVVYVSIGQPAVVKIDALPDVELAGHVSEINLEPVDYRGDVTYPVVVTLDETHPRLKLGMTTQVELRRGD